MDFVGAEVGNAIRVRADFGARAFEFAAADVGEIFAIWTRRRFFVEENRDPEFAADFRAEFAGEGDTIVHRRAVERNEGADVGGTDARVLSGVRGEVDRVAGLCDPRKRRGYGGRDRRDEGDDGAIVARIRGDVEDRHAVGSRDGVNDRGNDFGAASFGEIRNALDELHGGTGSG